MIIRSHKLSSTCSTIVGVRILVTFFHQTRTTFVQSFIPFIGVKIHRELIVLGLTGVMIIVGFTLLLESLVKFGVN